MGNPSKMFEMIRLFPFLDSDPLTGKIGEIYFNKTSLTLRVCIDDSPVAWSGVGGGASLDEIFKASNTAIVSGSWAVNYTSPDTEVIISGANIQAPGEAIHPIAAGTYVLSPDQVLYVDLGNSTPGIANADALTFAPNRYIIARSFGPSVLIAERELVRDGENIDLTSGHRNFTSQDLNFKVIGAANWEYNTDLAGPTTGLRLNQDSNLLISGLGLAEISSGEYEILSGEILYASIDRKTLGPVALQTTAVNSEIPQDSIYLAYNDGTNLWLWNGVKLAVGESWEPNNGQGGGGSGTGAVKANYLDPISTTLPTGTSVTIDNESGSNGDLVLFTNLASGNNVIYELGGVGTSLTWTPMPLFAGVTNPTNGDSVRVLDGASFGGQLAVYNGTEFTVNDIVRFFDGVSGDFWELGSIKTTIIANNDTQPLFTVNKNGSENMILDFSIVRGLTKEVGQVFVTHDGTNVSVAKTSTNIGNAGVTFSGSISVNDLTISYTSDASGTGTLKYYLKRWSDLPGGPTGVPSYSGGGGSGGSAGGNQAEIQFNDTGLLNGSPLMKWDGGSITGAINGAIDLNGLKISTLSSSVNLNFGQVSPLMCIQYPASVQSCVIEYSILRDTATRVGRLMITSTGSIIAYNDDYVESAITGITLSAGINGANVEVYYVSTGSPSVSGTLKYTLRRW